MSRPKLKRKPATKGKGKRTYGFAAVVGAAVAVLLAAAWQALPEAPLPAIPFSPRDTFAAHRSVGFESPHQLRVVQKAAGLDPAASRDALHLRDSTDFPLNQYRGFLVPANATGAAPWLCERISMPARAEDFFDEYVLPRKPVVIRAPALSVPDLGEPAGFSHLGWRTDRWTDDYMVQRAGSLAVEVEKVQESADDIQRFGVDYADTTFREFMASLNSDSGDAAFYLNVQNLKAKGQKLSDMLHAFRDDFSLLLPFIPKAMRLHEVNPWLGDTKTHAASTSPLHYDPFDNVYALIRGKKTFRIFSPSDAENLYPKHRLDHISPEGSFARTNSFPVASFAEVRQVGGQPARGASAQLFPRAERARPGLCTLTAGEILYLPAGWFHEVTSLPQGGHSRHHALNFWYMPPTANSTSSFPYLGGSGRENADALLLCYDSAVRKFTRQLSEMAATLGTGATYPGLAALGAWYSGEGRTGVGNDGAALVVSEVAQCSAGSLNVFDHLSTATVRYKDHRYAHAGLALRDLARAHAANLGNLRWKNDADLLFVAMATIHGMGAEWRRALVQLERAVRHTPTRTRTHFMLGEAHTHLGNHSAAAKGFAMCVSLEPRKILCWRKLGETLRALERRLDAGVALQRAAELEKEEAEFTDV